jgi:hypothetical protein
VTTKSRLGRLAKVEARRKGQCAGPKSPYITLEMRRLLADRLRAPGDPPLDVDDWPLDVDEVARAVAGARADAVDNDPVTAEGPMECSNAPQYGFSLSLLSKAQSGSSSRRSNVPAEGR